MCLVLCRHIGASRIHYFHAAQISICSYSNKYRELHTSVSFAQDTKSGSSHAAHLHETQPALLKTPRISDSKRTGPVRSRLGRIDLLKSSKDNLQAVSEGRGAAVTASQRVILGQPADQPIRARFAPSPTGYLHLGSLRTALFNNVAARATKDGAFILRIEDTDQSRLVHDAEKRLLEDLSWAGLSWDEGPDRGGPYGPYRQSERLSIYSDHVNGLIEDGKAYRCFCTSEQLEAQKRKLHEAGQPTIYPGTCRSIDASESSQRAASGEAHVVRFRSDLFGKPKLRDAIYGVFQKKDGEEDFILLKTDGFPTYHLANVIDDHLMKITHVIRGEEWLISTPKHIALYEAFGWQPPTFAHLGLLISADGTKLSKRNASVDITKYKDGDIFPMALLAWLANLGSSFRSKVQPPRSIEDVAEALTFKFTRGGIKLNFEKLVHFNTKYRDLLLRQSTEELSSYEKKVLNHHLIKPTICAVEAATKNGTSTWPDAPLELVPALSSTTLDARPASSAEYIHKVLTYRDGGFQDPATLIDQHPYLFWRVPDGVYERSLSQRTKESFDVRVLDALAKISSDARYWKTDGAQDEAFSPMAGLRDILDSQGIEPLMIHNMLRLVAAGGQDVISVSSGRMFLLLGQEEWAHRLKVVQRLLHDN